MKTFDRFVLASECALTLFACSAGPAAFELWRRGTDKLSGYSAVVGVPACAALLFVIVCLVVPDVLAVGRLRFPLPLSLPAVFSALLMSCALAVTTQQVGIVENQPQVDLGRIWTRPGALLASAVASAVALGLLCLLRQDDDGQPVESP